MKNIGIINHCSALTGSRVAYAVQQLQELEFPITLIDPSLSEKYDICLLLKDTPEQAPDPHTITINTAVQTESIIERILQKLPFDFEQLSLLVEGESKIIKYWTPKVVIEKFKPTVYSYTHNRYGLVDGTDAIRIKFTTAIYRKMTAYGKGRPYAPASAFLAEIENEQGLFIVQHLVDTCNIETRIKRYHIGSPVHRYLYTAKYPSTRKDQAPITTWTRFDTPVVCFDWRHPLTDEKNNRLADEPISDDYAALWILDLPFAKKMALETFLWLEKMFFQSGITLIDMCIFIDRTGKLIYGEISPDCMRIRWNSLHPEQAESMDKDLWRKGAAPEKLYENYEKAYSSMFNINQE
ncbi:phosphoribosylaminoimidazolesuccinocarboxamide synthase [Chitinophaga sp. RAB17]|uniref:phosphoribosylaminoimidazolesuccinocarboxamide synthase n=1 Tax=Chitinophaga sp. RAB17 TaxID=3233049 RepID=UPI003F91BE1F